MRERDLELFLGRLFGDNGGGGGLRLRVRGRRGGIGGLGGLVADLGPKDFDETIVHDRLGDNVSLEKKKRGHL